LEPGNDSVVTKVDSTQIIGTLKDEEQKQIKQKSNETAKEESNSITEESQKTDQIITNKENEVVAFAEPQAINLSQAYSLFKKDVLFIDARDESDYLAGHITGSLNIPFEDFDNHKQKLEQIPKEKPIVIYCAGTECDLSPLLANLLFEQGYKQVYVFFGGWVEWQEANYPMEHQ
jgi:rhodanese-related sulfurtransferase